MTRNDAAGRPAAGRGGLLDALRLAAALLIVLYHYGESAPVMLESLHPVFGRGYLATDFFLILSGYVLGRAYGRQVAERAVGTGAFLVRRLARIWPGQLIVLAGFMAVVTLAAASGLTPDHREHYLVEDFVRQALLVHAWGVPGHEGWNAPSWSLSALAVCYAAFPLAWRMVARLSGAGALALGMAAVMAGDLACRAAFGHVLYDLPFNLGVVRAAPLFLLGACVARAAEQRILAPQRARELLALSGAWFVGIQMLGRLDLASITAIAAVVLACGSMEVARPSRLIERGAKLSFALFITHALTSLVWFGVMGRLELSVPAQWLGWALAFPATVIAAALFHRYVDTPVQARLAPWLRPRPAPRPAPAPSG